MGCNGCRDVTGSGGVLIMSVSAIVPEISHGNKKRDEDFFDRWRDYSQKWILRLKFLQNL